MAYTFKNLVKNMTSGTDTYYTCPASTTAFLKDVTVCNFHASTNGNATVYINDSSGSVDGYYLKSVLINTGVAVTLPLITLEAGDTLKGTASGNSIYTISGTLIEKV